LMVLNLLNIRDLLDMNGKYGLFFYESEFVFA
jgi:hypothetical protein